MYIEVNDLVKKYGSGDAEVYALDHAEFSMDKGEICVVLGPSGSGKSTLLNILGGIDSADEGRVVIDGKEITKLNKKELVEYRRSDVGFIFQFYNLIPDLNVRENIQAVAEISTEAMDIDKVMEDLGISELATRFPKELSGGQQQRAAIARAVSKRPKLLMCDELTGALDSKSSKNVLCLIQKINGLYNSTVIIITHNEEIAKLADRVIRLKDGKVVSNVKNSEKMKAEDLEA